MNTPPTAGSVGRDDFAAGALGLGVDDVVTALVDDRSRMVDELAALVRIPSISVQPEHAGDVEAAAQATANLLRDAGMPSVEVVTAGGCRPAVIGSWVVDEDAPTVVLYAHHDVQPVATADRWTSPPFEPTVRNGRLYGRGSGDDKAGVMAHVAALRAWKAARGQPPVNVTVIIEGEEEIGSPQLPAFLDAYGHRLTGDAIVVTDLANWSVGWPAITRSIRGLVSMTVTLRSLAQPVHSGLWGGVVPDALTGMARLIASLHHDDGSIAVDRLSDDVAPPSAAERAELETFAYHDDQIRSDANLLDGVRLVGNPAVHPLERIWWQPSITPTGMDVTPVPQASNTLLAQVRTKLTCRLAPGQDPHRAAAAIVEHLERHTPWGLHLDVEVAETNPAWTTSSSTSAWAAMHTAMVAAYGREPAVIGCGGTIPLVGPLSDALGGAPCLLIGAMDPTSNAHGEDESVAIDDLARTALTEALLLALLADVVDR